MSNYLNNYRAIEMEPVLEDDTLYSQDNGAVYCGACSGASARYTGHDISGQRVVAYEAGAEWPWNAPVRCESCKKEA